MSTLLFASVLPCLASVFGYADHRLLRVPNPVGVMAVAFGASMFIIGIGRVLPQAHPRDWSKDVLGTDASPHMRLNGALSLLLLAGALNARVDQLSGRKLTVPSLAMPGVLLATALFGLGIWAAFRLRGLAVPLGLAVRPVSVVVPTYRLHVRRPGTWKAVAVLTWGAGCGVAFPCPWR